ncbi:MAG: septum formation initiator family protein [Clostridiales Family XIII bacterium]|jgi:cell division protein FtsB|nr:septum formation initiator family protein [Clostridiales Family XIII bacterium]
MKRTIIEIETAQRRRKQKRAEIVKAEKVKRRQRRAAERKARPKMPLSKKLGACGVIAVAVLLFGMGGYRNIELTIEKAETEQVYEQKLAEKARLEKELTTVNDPEYVEQEARERFHLLKDGEILYVAPEEEPDTSQ